MCVIIWHVNRNAVISVFFLWSTCVVLSVLLFVLTCFHLHYFGGGVCVWVCV